MRLKKIRLAGFKSFVDPTNIPFPDDMTAVVGPNGCGKSNVIDAVRWVLGESSAKNLRGDAMTDVIFNGSSARKPVSQCSVELVFDNSSGRIQGEFANYVELSVKRLVTREAQSTYFLNGTKCRRRDVTDLFLGTGLGPRSYAIIEQGMISRLIESKPQELRIFIEEAAGISKYKERRRDTENRIRHTKENLERLDDVRSELGQQIEKLQRQASAAKKYKELKAKERLLKGQLSAIRWLKHSQHIEELENAIALQQNDIEAFVAKQRGDEKGITEFRDQQQDLKQQVDSLQQDNFLVGTEITKLEQNRLHAKQRATQIESELSDIQSNIDESLHFEQEESDKLAQLSTQLQRLEPEAEAFAAQLEDAQDRLQASQEQLRAHEALWREHDQDFQQTKQQAQRCHSQIQATMNMQMRTQQRIGELQTEQNELEHDLLAQQIESLQHQVAQSKGRHKHADERVEQIETQLKQSQEQEKDFQEQLFELNGQIQSLNAQKSALQSLQQESQSNQNLTESLEALNIPFEAMWKQLEVESGWERAVETVMNEWQEAIWPQGEVSINDLPLDCAGKLLIQNRLSTQKIENTLSSKIHNHAFPHWLSDILIAQDVDSALRMLDNLQLHQSIVTQCGKRFGIDWVDFGDNDAPEGLIERAARISALDKQIESLKEQQKSPLELKISQCASSSEQLQGRLNTATSDFKQAEQALTQQQNQLNLLEMQHQQTLIRQTRISEELSRQQQLLEDEKIQSEQLAEQVQELELQLEDMSGKQVELESGKSQLLDSEQHCRHQLEHLTSQSHQLALTIQEIKSQHSGGLEAHKRTRQMLETLQKRQIQLQQESSVISQPFEEQQQQLETLLARRLEIEQQQQMLSDQLAEVDSKLASAEKGQHGIIEKIQQMRAELESKKLECEGYRVRANSTLEQLEEINESLKTILEGLPEENDEKQWQQSLERTQASVSRLGAVNLAAVEEYEIQAKRKHHLDEQNDDLVSALETLESAIRKIDKETRTRFKTTYDKVNADLKELFPKVFGGGAAYLELTGEDLLETGVTIMARPPGKKNSTIHLLSGGEKALTALSLVFAIFRLNPAPFCLLDEVDAPLDDANVGRFCKLVSEMSKSVQFIYITHNKIAMEMAKHLTGVTMAEPGVSRMVAVDVEEAVAIAQA